MFKKSRRSGGDAVSIVSALDKSLAIIEFDLNGKILDANDNFCQAMGYERSEIVGQHHRMFVDPEYAKSAEYREFWATQRAVAKSGSRRPITR